MRVVLALAAACGAARAAGPAPSAFAPPMEGAPSIGSAELGLEAVRKESVLVFHSPGNARLAGQVAEALERGARVSRGLVGRALRVHGLVLVRDRAELPEGLRGAQWANVDGVACLVQATPERELPIASAQTNFMLFALLPHEDVDIGLKREYFGGRLRPETATSRWLVEGIAEHCAYQSGARFQKGAAARMREGYLDGLGKLAAPAIDLADGGTWWPKGGSGRPEEAAHAYAAAHYVIAELSRAYGRRWLRRALERFGEGSGRSSADFCAAASAAAGTDVCAKIRKVDVAEVRRFALSL